MRTRRGLIGWKWLVLSGSLVVGLLAGCGSPQAEMASSEPPSDEGAIAMYAPSDDDAASDGPAAPDDAHMAAGDEPLEEMYPPESDVDTPPVDAAAEPGDGPDRFEGEARVKESVIRPVPRMQGGAPSRDRSVGGTDDEPAATPGESMAEPAPLPADPTDLPEATPFTAVKVFYATDRLPLEDGPEGARKGLTVASFAMAGVACIAVGLLMWRRRLTGRLATLLVVLALVAGIYGTVRSWPTLQQVADPGVRYGNERGPVQYGTCEVTIPATHVSGEVERPSILRLEVREDIERHMVLRETLPTDEEAFFADLRATVEQAARSEVFVFVHGYNVTFAGAARRTAQIAYDVHFAGAPVFFSWPSQGGLLKYTVDETNVEWAVPHVRQFLLDVARRSGARYVNLIAHSMGSRALTTALRELQLQLGSEVGLFHQIILAAPDIDAEIFRRDLAPALIHAAGRVTLYSSSNDQALVASKQVHGYARAGDSGAGLVVLPGIDTVDVSVLDTSLLGHSYYGSSDPILLDIGQVIRDAIPAAQRSSLTPRPYGELVYWVFDKAGTSVSGDAEARHP